MRLATQVIVFVFCAGPPAAAAAPDGVADVIDLANSLRRQDCRQARAAPGALSRDPRLDDAARRIANGQELEAATSAAGYRARASAFVHVTTTRGNAGIEETLGKRFCGILADPELSEIGAFRRGDDTWLVLARPLLPSQAAAGALHERVLQLINEARRQSRRCGDETYPATLPLRSNANLRQAALVHAGDLAARGRLGHAGSDRSQPADRASRAGYAWKAIAENIAAGQPSAEEVVRTWLSSPGHCRNLMDSRYSETGIAHAVNPDAENGIYWVQVFAAPE